jgi:hypothetical protein
MGVFDVSNPKPDDPYFRGRAFDQHGVNEVSSVFRKHSATSFCWKRQAPLLKVTIVTPVITPAVLGFLILFNARKMCSLTRRSEFGASSLGKENFRRNRHYRV